MNVDEVLSFKPEVGFKRLHQSIAASNNDSDSKKLDTKSYHDASTEDILNMIDQQPETEPLTEQVIYKMVNQLEKKMLQNCEMRIKYSDCAQKFMQSELELFTAVNRLHALTTDERLYPVFVRMRGLRHVMQLCCHENTDLVVTAITFLHDVFDFEDSGKSVHDDIQEYLAEQFVHAEQGITCFVDVLSRLDETINEESQAVHNILAIVESLIDIDAQQYSEAIVEQGFFKWLLGRLRMRRNVELEHNRLFVTEILSLLLQNSDSNKQKLGELDGVDVLLQQLAHYKRRDPNTAQELEIMLNLFDSLCSALLVTENKQRFLQAEGLQLMNLLLREMRKSRYGALKVLNYSTSGEGGAENCEKLIEIYGLRTLFPLFMHTPSRTRRKGMTAEQYEEHILTVIRSLLRNSKGVLRQRVMNKFIENDLEKLDRLIELHLKYVKLVQSNDISSQDSSKDDEISLYMKKLDSGLFTLQMIALIIAELYAGVWSVSTMTQQQFRQRINHTLSMRSASMRTVYNVLREYSQNIGDKEDSEGKESELQYIYHLMEKF